MAANRIVSDNLKRQAIFDTHSWMGIAESNKREADKWKKSYDTEYTRGLYLGAKTVEQQEALIACNADKSKLKAWATIGRISVVTVAALVVIQYIHINK